MPATKTTHTPGPWQFACDSYGKVRHSRKACVFTTLESAGGDRLVTIAGRIENWKDACLIAAAPELRARLQALVTYWDELGCVCDPHDLHYPKGCIGCEARALLARIDGGE